MIVVSNSTPLIGLASIGRFELLQQLFGEIQIATAVYAETVTMGRREEVECKTSSISSHLD